MPASPLFPSLPAHWKEEQVKTEGLSLRLWYNPAFPRARALYIVHGFGEQSDRYLHFTHYLQFTVDVVAAIDLPGHGLSEGPRGHIDHFSKVTEAATRGLQMLQKWLVEKKQNPVLHWMGHSFGGLTTLNLMRNSEMPAGPQSWIVSAPLLDLSMPVPKVKKFFGELIAPILPRLSLANEINPEALSKDPLVGEEYKSNSLNHSMITPRMFLEMNRAMQETREWEGPLPGPTLFIIPTQDRVVSGPEAMRFALQLRTSSASEKMISLWPDVSHESFNDLEKGRVFNLIENWILKHS